VRAASPAVVYIESHQRTFVGFRNGRPVEGSHVVSGSGAVLHASGYVITNAHVIGSYPERVTVEFDAALDPTVYEAQVVNIAPADDLALLKIESDREFPVLTRGTSRDLMLGERVIAIGNPLRQRLSVSSGIISGLHRSVSFNSSYTFHDLIQTDAAINPGNSGGPLLNILGELVGITTVVNEGAENMGFAIPVDRVAEVYNDVLLVTDVARAWFGMEIDESCEFSVVAVSPGGPAQIAGVQPGDRLTRLEGNAVVDSESYRAALVALRPDEPTELVFARKDPDGSEQLLPVTLEGWTRIRRVLHERAGLAVDQVWLSGEYPRVRVVSVQEGGPAALLGLRAGDVLDSLRVPGGRAWIVSSPGNFAGIVWRVPPDTEVELDVRRDADGNGRLTDEEFLRGTLRLR
jgi:serine protease Do